MTSVQQVARMLSRQPAPPLRLRWGSVDTVNGDGTVDLTIGGRTLVVESVPYLDGASLSAADTVAVVVNGRDMFVLGKMA